MRLLFFISIGFSFNFISGQNLNTEIESYLIDKKFNKAQSLCSSKAQNLDEQSFIKCGHAFEFTKNEIKAAKLYDMGLKKYPSNFQIRYEKALLFLNNNKDYEASLTLLPLLQSHKDQPIVHNAIGRAEYNQNRTAALMALIISEFLDANTKYSQQNIISIKELFQRKIFIKTTSSKNGMSLNTTYSNQKKNFSTNSFNHTDFVLSTQSVVGNFNITNEIELLSKQFEILGTSLKETDHSKQGEYWSYYAPLFIKIQEKNLSKTAAYYLLRSTKPEYNSWLSQNNQNTMALQKIINDSF